jgi:hypothetical protein
VPSHLLPIFSPHPSIIHFSSFSHPPLVHSSPISYSSLTDFSPMSHPSLTYFSPISHPFLTHFTSWTKFNLVLFDLILELVSKELNHFGVIADLFRQIGGHSSRFVLFCSFWRLFTIRMIKSVKLFPFSFWKIITIFFLLHKIQIPGINMQNDSQVI